MRVHPAASVSLLDQLKDLHEAVVVRNSESEEQPILKTFLDL